MPGTRSASHETQSEKHPKPETRPVVDPAPGTVSSLAGPALEHAPVPLSPPSHLNPAGVRALQRTVGNRAVTQLLQQRQRQPGVELTAQSSRIRRQVHPLLQRAEEAGTTQEAIAISTTGPLKLLSDELNSQRPVEDKILTYLSQLGPGQRAIVREDASLLAKLVKAIQNINNTRKAIELLDGSLVWTLHWINQNPLAAGMIGSHGFFKLIQAATKAELIELLKSKDDAEILFKHYQYDNPIDLVGPVLGAGGIARYISISASFANWMLTKAGAAALMVYFAANSPQALIKALMIRKKWADFLTALPSGKSLTREEETAMRALFDAAADGSDREKIFEQRFGAAETHTAAEWKSRGEAFWTAQETKVNGLLPGQTTTGGDKNVSAYADDPLKKALVKELLKPQADPIACISLLNSLPRGYMYQVRSDAFILQKLARILKNKDLVTQALARLDFPDPRSTMKFILDADMKYSLDKPFYRRLLFEVDILGLINLIADDKSFDILKNHSYINPLTIPCLASNGAALGALFVDQPRFFEWVIRMIDGDAFLQYISHNMPEYTGPLLVKAQKLDALLNELPPGFSIPAKTQAAMYRLFIAISDIEAKKKLLKKRFELDDVKNMGTKPWTKKSIEKIWELVQRLPPAMIQGAFKKLERSVNVPSGTAGFSGTSDIEGTIEVAFDPAKMEVLDTGQFSSTGDVLHNTKIFDRGIIHEIGHSADYRHKLTEVGSLLQTEVDLGAWKVYNPNSQAAALYDTLLTDSGESIADWTPPAKNLVRKILVNALKKHKKPSEARVEAENAETDQTAKLGVRTIFTGQIQPLKMTKIIEEYGDEGQRPWDNSFNTPINGRAYHRAYSNEWVSYIAAARSAGKLSNYQFRNHMEYFAETFAAFYLTPDDPGRLVKAWNEKVYNWFVANVDKGYSTRKKSTTGGH